MPSEPGRDPSPAVLEVRAADGRDRGESMTVFAERGRPRLA
ncbi:MAG: hypothetical protein ACREM3_26340 [Candidatus Rokuibacteriota bacterium]